MDITEEIIEEEAMSGKLKITENTKGGDTTDTDTPGFGEGILLNLLTLTQGLAILYGIQSPADNWRPGLVCVVTVVCPLELKQQAPAGCSP